MITLKLIDDNGNVAYRGEALDPLARVILWRGRYFAFDFYMRADDTMFYNEVRCAAI